MKTIVRRAGRALLCASLWSVSACKDDAELLVGSQDGAVSDSGLLDAALPASDAGSAADADCYTNPTRHIEIINACTSADKIEKRPVLPLLLLDGGLPPLP